MTLLYSIWIDVEDIFQYFEGNARPSGIQRVVYEILRVIRRQADARDTAIQVNLIRRSAVALEQAAVEGRALFSSVSFADLENVFEKSLGRSTNTFRTQDDGAAQNGSPLSFFTRLRHMLILRLEAIPPEVGAPLLMIAIKQLRVARLARRYVTIRRHRTVTTPVPPSKPIKDPVAEQSEAAWHDVPQPGDIFLILGAAWSDRSFGDRLAAMRSAYQIEPVLLIYDLIPALRPEWCARSLITDFRYWLNSTLPQCGRLLAISQATAQSVDAYARDNGLKLIAPVQPIPMGSGFGPKRGLGVRPKGLPPVQSYVLFVSTLEARKNHMLAFVVWQRLLSELPRQEVPTLVFAGREGWLVADLMQQIENADWLHGKIRLLRDPTDDELAHLYNGCLLTFFPSFFEGWGLPVTESLINGAPCVASNSTSIPEAGGALSGYFDPENVDDAYRVICETLADREGIARWRQEVGKQFKPIPWEKTADAILDACDLAYRDRNI